MAFELQQANSNGSNLLQLMKVKPKYIKFGSGNMQLFGLCGKIKVPRENPQEHANATEGLHNARPVCGAKCCYENPSNRRKDACSLRINKILVIVGTFDVLGV